MIYQYRKYKNIDSFVKNISKSSTDEDYTIIDKCNGLDYQNKSFTDKCFGCLFCIFDDPDLMSSFKNLWGQDFIASYASKAFKGCPVTLPNAKQCIRNPIKNLESFTEIDETAHIQPWAAGIVNHMCTGHNRISMEVPVFNMDYERNGRLDVCSMYDSDLLTLESKTSLDEALKDERFVEQYSKYTVEIEKSTMKYTYLTLFGGKETDLFPPSSQYCTGKTGNKSERFYSLVKNNEIRFISAAALWCLCCKFLTDGSDYAWDVFLKESFINPECIGILSAGKVINKEGDITIEQF